jgi:CRISPR/Cas system-associated endonuclease Cas3-HD
LDDHELVQMVHLFVLTHRQAIHESNKQKKTRSYIKYLCIKDRSKDFKRVIHSVLSIGVMATLKMKLQIRQYIYAGTRGTVKCI